MPPSAVGPPLQPTVGRRLNNQGGSSAGANSKYTLPDKIQCTLCERSKPQTEYSKNQLRNYASNFYNAYAPGGRTKKQAKPTCRACTTSQVEELQCLICEEYKPLEKFAKTRRNPDTARCAACMGHTNDVEPDIACPDSDEYASSDSDDDFDVPKKPKVKKPAANTQKIDSYYATAASNTNATGTGYHTPAEMDAGANNDLEWSTVTKSSRRFASMTNTNSSRASTTGTGGMSTPTNRSSAPSTNKGGWAKVRKVKDEEALPWNDHFSGYAPGGNVNPYRKAKAKKDDSDDDSW